MNPIGYAIRKPVTVLVGVILVVLFGTLAAVSLPIQLTPNVDRPRITVTTRWEGASPREVEREIVDEQEDKLKRVEGLRKMRSTAVEGQARVELEFLVGVNLPKALLEVSDKLRQVPEYPENVDEPIVAAGDTEGAEAIAWFVMRRSDGSSLEPERVPLFRTLVEEEVQPRLERTDGVASVGVFGGVEREVHVRVDLRKLAARRLSLLDVRDAIRRRNVDTSAGTIEQGKRSYTIRTVGRFGTLRDLEDLVLARRDGRPVHLRDVAAVEMGYKEAVSVVRSRGEPAIAINATRQAGTNVITVMKGLREAVHRVNRDLLRSRGLELEQVYDQTKYIYNAIDLVFQNLWVGGTLAIAVMLLFLREVRSTLVVAMAIPISVIGSFLALILLGRNLNVVSLAGLAFAVGMVVDNSIVVLENIDRHRRGGERPFEAAWKGTREVWGAVLASTLTTLAVFIPVLFVREEAGQLFRDIAIAICAAVFLSLLVSVFFIPMASARLYGARGVGARAPRFGLRAVVALGRGFTAGVSALVAWLNRSVARRVVTVTALTAASILLSRVFLPPMTYLPAGNQNIVFGFLIPPPGYNVEEFEAIAARIEGRLRPYWEAKGDLDETLRRPGWYRGGPPIPGIENFFYVAFGQTVFLGAASTDERNVRPLVDLVQHAVSDLPGVFAFAAQRSLFERGITSGNTIDLEVSGSDMGEIVAAAGALIGRIRPVLGMPRPEPSNFDLGAPEVRVHVDEARAADLGLSVADLGFVVRAMVDGAIVSDYRDRGVTIDVKLLPAAWRTRFVEEIGTLPLYVRGSASPVPLSSVAGLEETTAPTEIRHIEEKRAVKLIVTPPEGMELSSAMGVLRGEILAPMRAAGAIPPGVSTTLAGTADKLVSTRKALQWNLLLAVVITYLLLASLFESFLYPVVILFSVPLAAVGGILGLRILHEITGHQMDLLTMLGFVILVGTVVNNAILIVHQALNYMRDKGMESGKAIRESVRTRVRPIFMSTSTSVLGMVPLVVSPGAGSELYRGLGSVVIGGLVASTVFTLLVVPTLFSLVIGGTRGLGRALGRGASPLPAAAPAKSGMDKPFPEWHTSR